MSYPNNAERQAREREVSILKPLVSLDQGSKTARSSLGHATFRFPDLPEQEADALFIQSVSNFLRLILSVQCVQYVLSKSIWCGESQLAV